MKVEAENAGWTIEIELEGSLGRLTECIWPSNNIGSAYNRLTSRHKVGLGFSYFHAVFPRHLEPLTRDQTALATAELPVVSGVAALGGLKFAISVDWVW